MLGQKSDTVPMEPWSRYQRDGAPFWRAQETVCFLAFCGFWELLPFLCSRPPLGIFKASGVVPSALLLLSHLLSLCISFFQLQEVLVGPCRYAGVNSLISASRALAADIFGWSNASSIVFYFQAPFSLSFYIPEVYLTVVHLFHSLRVFFYLRVNCFVLF